jgi:hypothetical protein
MPKDKGEKEMPLTKYRIQGLVSPEGKRPLYRIQYKFLFWWFEYTDDWGNGRYNDEEKAFHHLRCLRERAQKEVWKDV